MVKSNIIVLSLMLDLINTSLFVSSFHVTDNEIKSKQEANIFNISTPNDRIKRKIIMGGSKKWILPIYYTVANPLSEFLIAYALYKISKETCIKFEKRQILPTGNPGIIYHWVGDCQSFVGKQINEGWQGVEIGQFCYNIGGVIHETLHALGLFHEHCRHDSKKYVKLIRENIVNSRRNDFDTVCFAHSYDYYLSYDYGSIMHYGGYSYNGNYAKIIVPVDSNYDKTIGQYERLSFIDIKTLNLHYCSHVCPHKIKCANHGYQDPKNCEVCRCVEGFGGKLCQKYAKRQKGCKITEIIANRKKRKLYLGGKKYCVYHIKSSRNKIIFVTIEKLQIVPNNHYTCSYKNTLEINYQIDKSVTGARFCNIEKCKLIMSHNNYVIIYYRSSNSKNYAYLKYHAIDYRKKSFMGRRRRLKSI